MNESNLKKNYVIYTAIFGKRDVLLEPQYVPRNADFICFTDQNFESNIWTIRKVLPPVIDDLSRSNRYYKILAHKALPEYDVSIYIDGNVVITGDITKLIELYLDNANMAGFDHSYNSQIPLKSVGEQKDLLLTPKQRDRNKESFENIISQWESYKKTGFPDQGGLLWTMTLLRRHNAMDVRSAMESWWHELVTQSKRDQMSFNYIAWKHNLKFNYIPIDGSNNEYICRMRHHTPFSKKIKNRIRRFLGVFSFEKV